MLGKHMLSVIHLHLQEIRRTKQLFRGLNIVLVGDLHQLKPVKDGWIFEDPDANYGPLTPNLFTDNFELFELTEIMRQMDDIHFAELLNRLRSAEHTSEDIKMLSKRVIFKEDSISSAIFLIFILLMLKRIILTWQY